MFWVNPRVDTDQEVGFRRLISGGQETERQLGQSLQVGVLHGHDAAVAHSEHAVLGEDAVAALMYGGDAFAVGGGEVQLAGLPLGQEALVGEAGADVGAVEAAQFLHEGKFGLKAGRKIGGDGIFATALVHVDVLVFEQKVEKVIIMAGDFTTARTAEYNVRKDHFAAVRFYAECPVPMYFTDVALGRSVLYPYQAVYDSFNYVENHPAVKAFEYYAKMPYNRPLWDPTAVLFAAEPNGGYASLSKAGYVTVDQGSKTDFTEDKSSNRRYYIVNDKQRAKIVRRVVELTLRRPKAFEK